MYVHFKRDLLENHNNNYFNILLYIAILYLTSIPVFFFLKIAPININCHGNFHKHSGNARLKLRRHEVANMYEDKYQYQYLGY